MADERIYGGIDPGKTGAIALVHDSGFVEVWDWDDLRYMRELQWSDRISKIFIEKQQAFPKQGVVSVFKLGMNYGQWLGRLEAFNIPHEIITPQKWRKQMFDSMPKSADKKYTDSKAKSF